MNSVSSRLYAAATVTPKCVATEARDCAENDTTESSNARSLRALRSWAVDCCLISTVSAEVTQPLGTKTSLSVSPTLRTMSIHPCASYLHAKQSLSVIFAVFRLVGRSKPWSSVAGLQEYRVVRQPDDGSTAKR